MNLQVSAIRIGREKTIDQKDNDDVREHTGQHPVDLLFGEDTSGRLRRLEWNARLHNGVSPTHTFYPVRKHPQFLHTPNGRARH